MATQDVPGADPANADQLAAGCWAEHSDGSLIYVKGTENQQVVYEIYDVAQDPPVYYQDAMREEAFKRQFSFPPTGTSPEPWSWHDKKNFPWHRVMKTFDRPAPQHADVRDTLSAAAKVADSLKLRAQRLTEDRIGPRAEQTREKSRPIVQRLQRALDAFME